MTVSLNIDNQRIRLVSQHANRVDLWQILELPPGAIKDGMILNPPAVAALLKDHFQASKLPAQQVKVELTGLSFVYRVLTLPRLKPAKLKSAVERATQKEIALPLENLYLDWQIIKQNEQEIEIFVLGIARQMVDVLLDTLKLAGISLQTLELKALALARAVSHPEALVVDCEPSSFEILVVREGIPVTIHRVSPKNEMSTFEDNLNQMMNELNRTIDYFNLNHPGSPLTQATPVMLSGSLCDEPESRRLITQSIGHTVELFSSSMVLPGNFPISTFAANLGLLSQSPSAVKGKNMECIDLVRARRRVLSHPVKPQQLVFSGVIVAALLILTLLWFIRQQAVEQSSALQIRAASIDQELVAVHQQLETANQLQNQITVLSDSTRELGLERQELSGKGDLAAVLKSITGNLPAGTVFTRITTQTTKIIIDGLAESRPNIVNYVHNLEKPALFSEVRIALIDTGNVSSGTIYHFRIVIER
jgi:Tfp pilus assembly protein PilN